MKRFSRKIIEGIKKTSDFKDLTSLTLDICESPYVEDTLVEGRTPSLLCIGKSLEGNEIKFFIKYQPLFLTYKRAKERLENFATDVWTYFSSIKIDTKITNSGKFIFHGYELNSIPK